MLFVPHYPLSTSNNYIISKYLFKTQAFEESRVVFHWTSFQATNKIIVKKFAKI